MAWMTKEHILVDSGQWAGIVEIVRVSTFETGLRFKCFALGSQLGLMTSVYKTNFRDLIDQTKSNISKIIVENISF